MFGRTKASSVEDEQQHLNVLLREEIAKMNKKPKPTTSSKKKVVRSVKRKLPLPVKQWALVGEDGNYASWEDGVLELYRTKAKAITFKGCSSFFKPIRVEVRPCK